MIVSQSIARQGKCWIVSVPLYNDTGVCKGTFVLLFHRPGESKFREEWLQSILDSKSVVFNSIHL